MDVFAITCQKHICYVEANGDGYPHCPKGMKLPIAERCARTDWHMFQSDNHMMKLTGNVQTALADLNVISMRLAEAIKPVV